MNNQSIHRARRSAGLALAAAFLTSFVWSAPTATAQRVRGGLEVRVAAGEQGRVAVTTGMRTTVGSSRDRGHDRRYSGRRSTVRTVRRSPDRRDDVVVVGTARERGGRLGAYHIGNRHVRSPDLFGRGGRYDRGHRHVRRHGVRRGGHYVTRSVRVWVPGCTERVWVPARYEFRILPCGTRQRILVQAGHYRVVTHPGHYEWQERRVFVSRR